MRSARRGKTAEKWAIDFISTSAAKEGALYITRKGNSGGGCQQPGVIRPGKHVPRINMHGRTPESTVLSQPLPKDFYGKSYCLFFSFLTRHRVARFRWVSAQKKKKLRSERAGEGAVFFIKKKSSARGFVTHEMDVRKILESG